MKVSVSLPDVDIAFVDKIAVDSGLSRSAVMHQAIELLRKRDLGDQYAAAWDEWQASGESRAWEATTADGISDEAW